MILKTKKGKYLISTDKRKLQIKVIHGFLINSYWSKNIGIGLVRKSISNSVCFGVYSQKVQIGFARVVTDFTKIGYIADVFIIKEFRGKGLSKWLMECILNHPELKGLKSWMLATSDAHGLYSKFGFEPLKEPWKYMKKTGS